MNLHVTALTALLALTGSAFAASPTSAAAPSDAPSATAPADRTQWFREARFDLRGPATGWKPLSIRHVWLTPATP